MHIFVLLLLCFIIAFWSFQALRAAHGARSLPWLKDFAPAVDSQCPRISLIFAARDEEEKLPAALATLAAIDYPNLEIIGVNDRSSDATTRILSDFAAAHPRFRVVHITELPKAWLGKPHALQTGYELSTGEWLLFTDADVRFQPDVVRRAVSVAQQQGLDHLTLFCDAEMVGFWETVLITFFGMIFHLAHNPHSVSNPSSRTYVGVGAFQMLKRSAYEASGTHRRLALEVIDDMKLGKMVKLSGFHSGVAVAQDAVSVRWHSGLGNLIRGVTKNFYAATGYSFGFTILSVLGLLLLHIFPILCLALGSGWVRALGGAAACIPLVFLAGVDRVMRVSSFYAFTYPIGALLMCYMLLRSMVVTLKQGGIVWRDTFYSLDELKRSSV